MIVDKGKVKFKFSIILVSALLLVEWQYSNNKSSTKEPSHIQHLDSSKEYYTLILRGMNWDWSIKSCTYWKIHNSTKENYSPITELPIKIIPLNTASKFKVPKNFFPGDQLLKVTGRFIKKIDSKYITFEYNQIRVIYKDVELTKKDTTIKLSYFPLSCACAKWKPLNLKGDIGTNYFYTEPKSDQIIDINDLFRGNNLPITVEVTGKFISEYGYPKNYNPLKENPTAAKVFQYNEVRVLEQ